MFIGQTTYEEKQSPIISQKDLEDNTDINSIRNKHCESDSHLNNNESRAGSIIIAGNLDNQQCILSDSCKIVKDNHKIIYDNNQSLLRDILDVSDETSYLSLKPDLNKCINLFQDEQLSKEHHTFKEYSNLDAMLSEIKVSRDIESQHLNKKQTVEIQCNLIRDRPYAMSLNSLEDAIVSTKDQDVINDRIQRSKSCSILYNNLKRDTNHNVKTDYFCVPPINTATRKNSHEKIHTIFDPLSKSLSKLSILSKKNDSHLLEKDQKCDSISSETSSKEQFNSFELRTFLQSVEHQKPLKEAAVQERLLRRFSANFYNSPKTFTERLLTIIEESVVNDDSCAPLEYPNVSLCRLTEELRKMCKFIEDETIPDWPQSPQRISLSICMRQRSQGLKSPFQKSLNTFTSRDNSLAQCNIKSPKKICQHMPKNILYNTKSPLHDSTSTFESLEAFCEKFYADECKTAPIKEKNSSQPPLQNLDSILHACENQMASLESSLNIHEQLKKAAMFTSDLKSQYKVPEAQSRLFIHEKHNKANSKKVPDTFKQLTRHNKSYEMIEPDDLENTLMYEIAKKRQRCLDTAKVMMEIDTNSEPVKQICPEIVNNESSSTSDSKFIETLMSVKRYQEYLEKHKSVLNSFRTGPSNSYISDKKDVGTKEMTRGNFDSRHLGDRVENATLKVPKFSRMGKKSRSPSPMKCSTNKMVSKPKLFVTPGKMSINKSCKPKRTYFTSPNLVMGMNKKKKFNVSPHPKSIYRQIENYDHVVSPVGMYIKGTDPHLMQNLRPKTNENLLTPKKKQIRSPKPKVKFQLSPKQPKVVSGN